MPESFDYIVDEKTTTLVIGSMPGVASLNAGEYYAYRQNLFWRFVFEAFGKDFQNPTYSAKTKLLLKHHIGLWDAAKSCNRRGSLDTNIKNVIPNDFEKLFSEYPHIQQLLFNGQKAYQLFYRFHKELLNDKNYTVLPSTSPANASIPLAKKREMWIHQLNQK